MNDETKWLSSFKRRLLKFLEKGFFRVKINMLLKNFVVCKILNVDNFVMEE